MLLKRSNPQMDGPRVAIVWRGDEQTPDALQPETSRFKGIFAALNHRGFRPEPAPYDKRHVGAFAQRLREVDAVLVWVNPMDAGRSRKALDNILRDVAAAGIFVSAYPNVIDTMGVKAVLHRTRTWGGEPIRATMIRRRRSRRNFPPSFPRRRAY